MINGRSNHLEAPVTTATLPPPEAELYPLTLTEVTAGAPQDPER